MENDIFGDFNLDLGDEVATSYPQEIREKLAQQHQDNLRIWGEIEKLNLGKANYPNLLSEVSDEVKVQDETLEKPSASERNRVLTDPTLIFQHNAWDDVEWDESMENEALNVINKKSGKVDEDRRVLLETDASRFWDEFYDTHQNKFFKDRNWLLTEFPELFSAPVTPKVEENPRNEAYPGEFHTFKIFEIGCGVGNTIFPLLKANIDPSTYIYGCDFSASAIDIFKSNSEYQPGRCTAFVMDATILKDDPSTPFPPNSIDIIVLIFVLSAISPDKFDNVLKNCYNLLKPGGLILFRDYGRYDMAQLRFPNGRCIEDNFYVRGDGTRSYFFTEDEVIEIFERNGLRKRKTYVDKRLQVNRGKQVKMYRIWVLAKFYKPLLD